MSNLEVLFPNQGPMPSAASGDHPGRGLRVPPVLLLDLVCSGRGTCGKCRIRIQESDGCQHEVLACKTKLDRPLQILLKESDYVHWAQLLTAGYSGRSFDFSPALTKRFSLTGAAYPRLLWPICGSGRSLASCRTGPSDAAMPGCRATSAHRPGPYAGL